MRRPAWLGGPRRDREIADEIQAHLEMATRDRIQRGERPEDARLAALRELGNVGLVTEATRRVWTATTFEQLLQDVGFGARILRQAPGLSAAAVLLVGLVIGGNTTIYSTVHGLITNPARGVTADRLVCVGHVDPDSVLFGPYTSVPNYQDFAAQTRTVLGLTAWGSERLTIAIGDGTYAMFGGTVTTNFFATFGVHPALGRGFDDADDRLDSGLVVVISDRLWRDRFSRAAEVVGRSIRVNGQPATIVGVAPPGFHGAIMTPGEDLWVPLGAFYEAVGSRGLLTDRRTPAVVIAGQLAPGVSLAGARAEFAAMSTQLRTAYPADNKERRAQVIPYSATALLPVSQFAPTFLALFSVITLLTLLIVSANVANLMLARAVIRQRETAVRQSLGASRLRIVRMLVAEGATVSIAAWLAACAFAWGVSRLLIYALPPARQGLLPDVTPDWQVAAYAMALAMAATIAFTLAPAVRTWRQPVLPWLKAGEQAVAPGRSRLAGALVVLQLAFSVLLLTSAGLAYRSLSLIDSGDVGFDPDRLLLMTVRTGRSGNLPPDAAIGPAEREAALATLDRIRNRLREVRDIEAVSYGRRAPGPYAPVTVPVWSSGQEPRIEESTPALRRAVGPDYLRVLGLQPLAGRPIGEADGRGTTRVAMINQHLAAALFKGQSPIGQTIVVGSNREVVEVVGVAPDAFYDGPAHDPKPHFLFVAEQQSAGAPTVEPTFFIRHRGALDVVAPPLARALAEVNPQAPIVTMNTMAARLDTVTEMERLIAALLVFFAAGSLIVAALGQYAIIAFNMRRRTRDFGVRMALGASSHRIRRDVVREAFATTAIGLALGFVLSAATGTAFRSVLLGVTPTDPPTYAGVVVILAVTSIAASYLPAWRAGRVNVVEALRQE